MGIVAEWLDDLTQILIAVAIALDVLNLLPYRVSDGTIILKYWRWLRLKT